MGMVYGIGFATVPEFFKFNDFALCFFGRISVSPLETPVESGVA